MAYEGNGGRAISRERDTQKFRAKKDTKKVFFVYFVVFCLFFFCIWHAKKYDENPSLDRNFFLEKNNLFRLSYSLYSPVL